MQHLFIYVSFFILSLWGLALLLTLIDTLLNLAGIRIRYNIEPITRAYNYISDKFKTTETEKPYANLKNNIARQLAK